MRVFILEDSHSRMVLFREILFNANAVIDHFDTVQEAVDGFRNNYNLILLDHDLEDAHHDNLAQEVGTGTEFARWLAEHGEASQAPVIIHSYNPDGAQRMRKELEAAGWTVYVLPFGLTLLKNLEKLVRSITDGKTVISNWDRAEV